MKIKISEFDQQMDDVLETVNTIAITYTKQLDTCIEEVKELLKNKDDYFHQY